MRPWQFNALVAVSCVGTVLMMAVPAIGGHIGFAGLAGYAAVLTYVLSAGFADLSPAKTDARPELTAEETAVAVDLLAEKLARDEAEQPMDSQ